MANLSTITLSASIVDSMQVSLRRLASGEDEDLAKERRGHKCKKGYNEHTNLVNKRVWTRGVPGSQHLKRELSKERGHKCE